MGKSALFIPLFPTITYISIRSLGRDAVPQTSEIGNLSAITTRVTLGEAVALMCQLTVQIGVQGLTN